MAPTCAPSASSFVPQPLVAAVDLSDVADLAGSLAASAAITRAIPARMSGLTTAAPQRGGTNHHRAVRVAQDDLRSPG